MEAAHIEWLSDNIAIIRGGENFIYGQPYDFVCTLIKDNDKWIIKGFHGKYTPKIRRAIQKALFTSGIEQVEYERLNMNRVRHKKLNCGGAL